MNDNTFKYKINEDNSSIAIIELGAKVLGGSDSLTFNSLLEELVDKGISYFIINLEKVEVMNSSGLGMLVGALSNMKKRNARLALLSVPEKFKNLLSMTHLNKVFKLFSSLEEAIKAC